MTEETISIAVVEARRFLKRVKALRAEMDNPTATEWRYERIKNNERIYLSDLPKECGSVRRASLDLTRALADMRRPG